MSDKTLKQHLSEVMGKCGYVKKDAKAPATAGGFGFASAEHVFDKVRAELVERGICISGGSELEHFSVNGKVSNAVVKSTIVFHLGDEELSVSALGEGKNAGGKAVMGANTAANKYCIAKALLMSWGDDPEWEDDDDSPDETSAPWMVKCEAAAKRAKGDRAKFAPWWETYGESVKEACGTEQAALVHQLYRAMLKPMKDVEA